MLDNNVATITIMQDFTTCITELYNLCSYMYVHICHEKIYVHINFDQHFGLNNLISTDRSLMKFTRLHTYVMINCEFRTFLLVAPFNVNIMGEKLHSQGEQLQLNCLSDGGPVLEYTWLHSSNIIPNANTNILIINNVNTTHGGEYICNVTNNAGYDSKHITVYSKLNYYVWFAKIII